MDLDAQDRVVRRVESQDHRALGVLRKLDQVELLAHVHARDVHVGVPVELKDHLGLPRAGDRADAVEAPDHAHALFDRASEQRLDLFGRGVFVVGLDG